MLNRLLAALAVVSILLALGLSVLWWRAAHGHSDEFLHWSSGDTGRTTLFTTPDRVNVHIRRTQPDGTVTDYTRPIPFRNVLGGCLFAPAIWAAVRLRRRLRPRPSGSDLPALRGVR